MPASPPKYRRVAIIRLGNPFIELGKKGARRKGLVVRVVNSYREAIDFVQANNPCKVLFRYYDLDMRRWVYLAKNLTE